MSAGLRLAAFAAVLGLLLGAGALAGAAVGPEPAAERPPAHAQAARPHAEPARPQADAARPHAEGGHASEAAAPATAVRGLAVAEGGLRLVLDDPELRRGRTETLRLRIVDDRGRTVRDFDVEHEKRLHLIVARRDLRAFQHLHPEQRADGGWETALRLDEAGSYRVFTDVVHEGDAVTLASDLRVDGPAALRALPAPARTATTDGGLDVQLEAPRARPGEEAELRFTVRRDGVPVHTEPYLGAGGHLVALREGDLAFLHVHPTEHGHGGADAGGHDDAIGFAATFPTAGRYRLFLQVQHEGRVHTAAFTQEVRP